MEHIEQVLPADTVSVNKVKEFKHISLYMFTFTATFLPSKAKVQTLSLKYKIGTFNLSVKYTVLYTTNSHDIVACKFFT